MKSGLARSFRFQFAAALVVAGTAFPTLAQAQRMPVQKAVNWCIGKKATDKQIVAGCTSVLAEKGIKAANRAAAFKLRGLANRRLGDLDKAIDDFTSALKVLTKDASLYAARGQTYYQKKDYAAALTDLDRASALKPGDSIILSSRASVYSAMNEFDRALADANAAVAMDGKDADNYFTRARVYVARQDYFEALPDSMAQATPGAVEGRTSKADLDRAMADFDMVVRLAPKALGGRLYRGNLHSRKGDNTRAIEDYTVALSLDPEAAGVYNSRGLAYARLGDIDRAIGDYSEALRIVPASPVVLYNRSLNYLDKKDFDRTLQDLDEAVRLKPDYADAFNQRGWVYQLKGDLDRAYTDYDAAVRLNPYFSDAYCNRGAVLAKKGEFDRALADLNSSIGINPQSSSCLGVRGSIHQSKRDYDAALTDFNASLAVTPNNSVTLNNRGLAYANKGDYARALVDYNESLRLKPGSAVPTFNRASAYYNLGQYDLAIADYDETIRLDPGNKVAVDERAMTVAARDRHEAAKKTAPAGGSTPVTLKETPVVQPAVAERRVALVIANSAYTATAALTNPSHDADLVAGAMRDSGIEVTVVKDLDRAGMVNALKAFSTAAESADWAVIYYAGHGMEEAGTNYLIPVDARLNSARDVPDETIALDRLLSATEGARKLRMIVLDACRNNPFAANMKRKGGTRAATRGLARVEPVLGSVVIYAAKEGTTAQDGGGEGSPFALSFARRMVEPGVEIDKVFRRTRQDVLAATNNEQEPFVYGSLPAEDFYFRAH